MSPKEEVESLLSEGLSFAQQQLENRGEFYPFAYALTSEGETTAVEAYVAEEHPDTADDLVYLERGLRHAAEEGRYTAIAFFVDVRVQGPDDDESADAVQAGLEHDSGYCVDVFLPYEKQADGTVAYGELFASVREGSVFQACRSQ